MRYFLLMICICTSVYAGPGKHQLINSVDAISDVNDSKIFLLELKKLAISIKNKSKKDEDYYFAYDFEKSLEIVIRIKDYSVDNCYSARLEHYKAYGVKGDDFNSEKLPAGAKLSFYVLTKLCAKKKASKKEAKSL